MTIQYQTFTVSVRESQDADSELNRFLRSVRVLTVHKEFVSNGENSFWSLLVEYLPGVVGTKSSRSIKSSKPKVDYKEILSPEEFATFVKLREWRKRVAEKEGIPVYVVFTNEQLAMIIREKVSSSSDLLKIEGIGEARVTKYGDDVIKISGYALRSS